MPGVSSGTRTIECRACRSASGSPTPMNRRTAACGRGPFVVHHLRPPMTYSPPCRRIVAAMLVASGGDAGRGHGEAGPGLAGEEGDQPALLLSSAIGAYSVLE